MKGVLMELLITKMSRLSGDGNSEGHIAAAEEL